MQTHLLVGGNLSPTGTHFPDEGVVDLIMAPVGGSPAQVLLAWGDELTGALRYGMAGAFGTPAATGPFDLAASPGGRYTPVEATMSPADHATIIARFTNPGAPPELRQFVVARASVPAFDNRDGDTLGDRDELHRRCRSQRRHPLDRRCVARRRLRHGRREQRDEIAA
ncbi:MAG: hypothetical protein R3F11_05935 [Verrucomicrobiales bacterium]